MTSFEILNISEFKERVREDTMAVSAKFQQNVWVEKVFSHAEMYLSPFIGMPRDINN